MKLLKYTFLIFGFALLGLAGDNGSVLFEEVTSTNLPVSVVSGPGMDVESADLDNDGDIDIVIANEYQPNRILLNDGTGKFTSAVGILPLKNLDSEEIAIADLNGDGYLDLVFATEDHRVHEMYLGDSTGSFMTDISNRLPNSTANSVLTEDVNGDSIPDLLFGNANPSDTPGQNLLLINDGDANFTDETSTRLPAELDVTQDVKMGDMNGDGHKDIVVGNEDGNKILINNGSGVFTNETSTRLPLSNGEETRKVTLADVDGDLDLDIYFSNVVFQVGQFRQDRLLINDGNGFFTDETFLRLPTVNDNTLDAIFLDMDYDGDLDFFTVHSFTGQQMRVFENDSTGHFVEVTNSILPPGITGQGLGMKADFYNDDNLIDIYMVNRGTLDRLIFRLDTAKVGINFNGNTIPERIFLGQNYPNPFNPETSINFEIPAHLSGTVKLAVYDISGKEIQLLYSGSPQPGNYEYSFNGTGYPSGVFFYKLETAGYSITRKMLLLK